MSDESPYTAPTSQVLKGDAVDDSLHLLHLRLSLLYPILIPALLFLISLPLRTSHVGNFFEIITWILFAGMLIISVGYSICALYALVKSKTVDDLRKRILKLPLTVAATNLLLFCIPVAIASIKGGESSFLLALLTVSLLTIIVGYIYVILMLGIPATINKLSQKHL